MLEGLIIIFNLLSRYRKGFILRIFNSVSSVTSVADYVFE